MTFSILLIIVTKTNIKTVGMAQGEFNVLTAPNMAISLETVLKRIQAFNVGIVVNMGINNMNVISDLLYIFIGILNYFIFETHLLN
jgi:hypothetical protein